MLLVGAGALGCNRNHPAPTLDVSSDIEAAIAVAALGDDARIEVHDDPQSGQFVDAELAPIPYGEGAQWLAPPSRGGPPYVGGADPAIWLDTDRVVEAGRQLAHRVPLDGAAQQRTEERIAALRETMMRADERAQALLLDLPPERRIISTNSIRLGYFAQRYGLQILPIEGAGPLGNLDVDRLGPPGSPTATLDGLIVEVARRVASTQG